MSLTKLGRYELVRVIGKGAMGLVYEGRDPNLNRRVAIKTIKVENLSDEAAAEYAVRFRIEAHSAARLQHPNIVSVYDSDRDGDVAFLVMEFIQGDDLKQHLDQGQAYSLAQTRGIMEDLLSALDYAHRQGIVHRDIKPANLLIEQSGRVKLTDFGVARIDNVGDATRTQGTMVGTLKYMSPEQVQGRLIDARADIFAAGIVLYQLLTGKRPFEGPTDFSIIQQIVSHMPAAPTASNPRLPPAIDRVVARSLAKSRDERYANAKDFLTALQTACQEAEDATVVPPVRARQPGSAMPTPTWTGASSSVLSGTSGGTSTVTQELELVYWKDVKESGDASDLQLFIEKFPSGIYVELAQRRLKKLRGEDSSGARVAPDNTVFTGTIVLAPGQLPSAAPFASYEPTLKLPSGRPLGGAEPLPDFAETLAPTYLRLQPDAARVTPAAVLQTVSGSQAVEAAQPANAAATHAVHAARVGQPDAPVAAPAAGFKNAAENAANPTDVSDLAFGSAGSAGPRVTQPEVAQSDLSASKPANPTLSAPPPRTAGSANPARPAPAVGPGSLDDWYASDKPEIASAATKLSSSRAKSRFGLKPPQLAAATLACAMLVGGAVYGLQRLLVSPPATQAAAVQSAPVAGGTATPMASPTERVPAAQASAGTSASASTSAPTTGLVNTVAGSQAAPLAVTVASVQMPPPASETAATVANAAAPKLLPDEVRAAKKATLEKEKAVQKAARQALIEARAAEAAATEAVRRASPAPAAPAAVVVQAAPAPIVSAGPANPRQACEERRFLAFELCVADQCSKRAFAGHPVCAERRAMDERRRESDQVRR